MFEPKKHHPKWLLSLFPYLSFLLNDRRMLFNVLTGRVHFHWHYPWEAELEKEKTIFHPDFQYIPGTFIMPQNSEEN